MVKRLSTQISQSVLFCDFYTLLCSSKGCLPRCRRLKLVRAAAGATSCYFGANDVYLGFRWCSSVARAFGHSKGTLFCGVGIACQMQRVNQSSSDLSGSSSYRVRGSFRHSTAAGLSTQYRRPGSRLSNCCGSLSFPASDMLLQLVQQRRVCLACVDN
jgi:hypothetical protein